MKNLLFTLTAVLFTSTAFCQQTPQWSYATGNQKSLAGNPSSITSDNDGNIYSVAIFGDSLIMSNIKKPGGFYYLMKWDNVNNLLWAKAISINSNIKSVVYSPDGNLYLSGQFTDTITINGTVYTSNGGQDFIFMKYDKQGNLLWVKTGGGPGHDQTYLTGSLAAHPSGGFVFVGESRGQTLTFGNTTFTNQAYLQATGPKDGLLVVRYDSNGNVLWARSDGISRQIKAFGVAVDNQGRTLVVGSFRDSVIINGITYSAMPLGSSINDIIIRYANNGSIDWVSQQPDGSFFFIGSTPNGFIYTLGIGNTLRQFDSTGLFKWEKQFSNGGLSEPSDLKIDATGNAYVAGSYITKLVYAGDTVLKIPQDFSSLFIAKVKPDGSLAWIKGTEGAKLGGQSDAKISFSNTDLVCTGLYTKEVPFGTFTLPYYSMPGTFTNYNYFFARLSDATGLEKEKGTTASSNFTVYPNPATSSFTLALRELATKAQKVVLTDATGRVLLRNSLSNGERQLVINTSALAAGMYMVSVDGLGTEKVVVQ